MLSLRRVAIVCALLSVALPALAQASPSGKPGADSAEVDAVVHDACGKRMALLGEPPMHGFGKTLEFKVAVARRLIDECHFNAFFIESGIYDFLNIRKKLDAGQEVTQPIVAAAIGGLWATRETEPLLPLLLERAKDRKLVLGGLDDQLGRGTYAQSGMSTDLVQYLDGDARQECLSILNKHTLWQYTNDAPYGPKDKALIVGCLDRIEAAASKTKTKDAASDLAMVASLKRTFARDFPEPATGIDPRVRGFNDRDRSMFLNFQWLMSRLPPNSKVIVWAATNHVAKSLAGVPGQEAIVPLGAHIRRDFKEPAFTLGFSAYSGTYAMGRQPARPLSAAPESSLEAKAFAGGDADVRYFNSNQLREFGAIAARPNGPDFKTANWSDVLDGLVVFREERPPEVVKP